MKKQVQQEMLKQMVITIETASDENKPSNTRDSKPAESTSENKTTESSTTTGNQEKPVE